MLSELAFHCILCLFVMTVTIIAVFDVVMAELLRVQVFRRVTLCLLLGEWFSGVSKDCVAFKMSAASRTMTQNHIPEDLNPHSLSKYGTHIILCLCNADIFFIIKK